MQSHRRRTPVLPIGAGLSAIVVVAIVVAMVSLVLSTPAHAAGRIYVTPGGVGARDGLSWGSAKDLAPALADAVSGDELWVAAGIYKPTTPVDRGATFTLKSGVAIYGGFAGFETERGQRNWEANVVTLSGDIGLPNNDADNCYHVVTGASGATLDGVTISGGNANGGSTLNGGGMLNDASSPTVTHVIFSGNKAYYGGGMDNTNGSSPTLTYVTFSDNLGYAGGGGMSNHNGSSPTLSNVTFSGNRGTSQYGDGLGGGMYNHASSPTLTNVTFSANQATSWGGGMYTTDTSTPTLTDVTFKGNSASFGAGMANGYIGSNPTLTNVTFSGNSATQSGGAIYNRDGSPTLTNVLISGNQAVVAGGGIYNDLQSKPTLINVLISGNSAGSGGGIYNTGLSTSGYPVLTNVTISGNSASISGGGIYNDGNTSNPVIYNTIIWGNTATTSDPAIANRSGSIPAISYSLVEGSGGSASWKIAFGSNGGSNLDTDPLFVAAVPTAPSTRGNARLQSASPAINTGSSTGIASTDMDGQPRIVGSSVDMGAYERQPAGVRYVNHAATGSGSGYSWANALASLHEALAFAGSGDELWVAAGTYTPGDNRADTFQLKSGVAVYGGFAGTEGTRDARNWTTNSVTLSGEIGAAGSADNSYHVVTGATGATLDGVTVSGGNADGADLDSKGGGVLNNAAAPTLVNVTISNNSASASGGGMYNTSSSPSLTNVVIKGNKATNSSGGGMYNASSSPTLRHVTISGNSASAASGGGMYNASGSNPSIGNSIIWGNSANSDSAISNNSSVPFIRNSLVQGSGGSSAWNIAFGTNNGGNLDVDPLFTTAVPTAPSTGGDLRLQAASSAINSGLNTLLPVGVTSDLAGSPRIIGGTVDMGVYEVQSPTLVSITRASATNPTNAASVSFTVTFNMPVSGVDATDFVLTITGGQTGATISPTVGGSGTTWTVTANTIDHQIGTIRLDLQSDSGIATSDAPVIPLSNNGGFSVGEIYTIDRASPDTSITVSPSDPTNSTSATFGFSGNDGAGSGVQSFACQIDGGGFSACTSPHTINGLLHGSHTFQVRATDLVGNVEATPASYAWTVDTVPPEASIGAPSTTLTRGGPVSFVVTYSGADAVTLGDGNISLNSTGTATGSVSVSGSGTSTRTVTISAITGDGTLGISLAGSTASDLAGNTALTAGPSDSVSVDNTAPTVSMTSTTIDPTNVSAIPVTVTFSENVTGFTLADVTLGNATPSGFSGSGASYSFTLTPLDNGPVTAAIAAGVAQDAAGNLNAVAPEFSRIYDNNPLAMSLTSTAPAITNLTSIPITVAFGAPVEDFVASDLSITNATIASFSGSGMRYTIMLAPEAAGPVTVTIPPHAAHDAAGNPSGTNTGPHTLTRIYDNLRPVLSINGPVSAPTDKASSYVFTIKLSDNNGINRTTLGDGDVRVSGPRGYIAAATLETVVENIDGTVLATFRIPAPGGTWDVGDNGVYTISLAADAVYDLAGNAAAAIDLGEVTADLKCTVFLPIVMRSF